MISFLRDLRHAARSLARRPGFSLACISILGLAMGATTAVFSVVDQTIFRGAPYAYADRLVDVLDPHGSNLSPAKIVGWRQQPQIFERFEGYTSRQMDATDGGDPQRLFGLTISTGLLSMLEVQPALGRGFAVDEGRPGSDHLVLISDRLWRQRFGSDASVISRQMVLNDDRYTIIGVMPRRFRLLSEDEAFWLPMNLSATATQPARFYGLARLKRGLTPEAAQRSVDFVAGHLQQAQPLDLTWALRLEQKRVAYVDPSARAMLLVLLGAVGFVLLIACANVGGLSLAQIAGRDREMAVRSALGAGRAELIRRVLAESLVLAVAAGTLGVVLANWFIELVIAAAPADLAFMSTTPIEIDARVMAFTGALTLLTTILFGLLPAVRGSRPNLKTFLHGVGLTSASRGPARVSAALVVCEVALSMILLVGAMLMTRTMINLNRVNPGFQVDDVLTFQIGLPTDRYRSMDSRFAFVDDLTGRLKSLPSVTDVAVAGGLPPRGGGFSWGRTQAEGQSPSPQDVAIPINTVSADYFHALRIPLVAGHSFQASQHDGVIVISQAMAHQYWPDGGAVGHRFRMDPSEPWQTVVGIVGDVETHEGSRKLGSMHIYYPWPAGAAVPPGPPRMRGYDSRTFVVRAARPVAMVTAVKQAVWSIDRSLPVDKVTLLSDSYAESFDRERFVFLIMGAFALVALVLTAAGIFAVLAQAVSQRRHEVGIRVALGATRVDLFALIAVKGIWLAAGGAALGLMGSLALSRVLGGLLFNVGAADLFSFSTVAIVLGVVAVIASWLPARAMFRVDPAVTLKAE